MKNNLSRASIAIGIALIGFLANYINNNLPEECNTIYNEEVVEGGYIDASDWLDPNLLKQFRELSQCNGATRIIVVFHHTVTSDGTTAREICNITNDRFSLGCSYAATIHKNGKVIQANKFEEHSPSVGGMNTYVISFAFVGNYQDQELPLIMVKRACQIKAAFEAYSEENPDFKVESYSIHRNFKATLCPGDKAVKQLISYGIVSD